MPTHPVIPPVLAPTDRLALTASDARGAEPNMLPTHIVYCGNCCACWADGEPSGPVVQFGTNVPSCGWCAAIDG